MSMKEFRTGIKTMNYLEVISQQRIKILDLAVAYKLDSRNFFFLLSVAHTVSHGIRNNNFNWLMFIGLFLAILK